MKTFPRSPSLVWSLMWIGALVLLEAACGLAASSDSKPAERKLLYVAEPGIRNYLEYGGHGILVFDIDHGHQFVRRIPTAGLDDKGQPMNVKGICASVPLKRVYVTSLKTLMSIDLTTDKLIWERSYPGGCDRMAISPD